MDQAEEDLKRMKIIGWKAKVKDRQEWNGTVEQTKTHPGKEEDEKKEEEKRRTRTRRRRRIITIQYCACHAVQ